MIFSRCLLDNLSTSLPNALVLVYPLSLMGSSFRQQKRITLPESEYLLPVEHIAPIMENGLDNIPKTGTNSQSNID